MKFKNQTKWTDDFLKNLIRWCCAELGMPPDAILAANFGIHHNPRQWSGRANYKNMSIYIRIGGWMPDTPEYRAGGFHGPSIRAD